MKKVFQFIAVSALISCSNPDMNNNIVLKPVGQAKFPIDDRTSYKTMYLNTFIDKEGVECMIFLSMNKNSILFYNIQDRKLINEILLEKEGPNGVGNPSGLLYESEDSIFIFSSYKATLINSYGKVLRNYPILKAQEKPNINTGTVRPFTISPPIKINSVIYLNSSPDRDVYKPSYFDGNTRVSIDIKTGNINYFESYPEEYKGKVWGINATNYSTTYNGNNFIYSFVISDSLYLVEKIGFRKGFLAKTRLSNKNILSMQKPSYNNDLEYVLGNIQYDGIIYDKYRNVYYRFVKHPLPYKNDNGEINSFHSKPISIIVLNKSLEIIGETKLEDDKFTTSMYFVAQEGLFVSNSNPKNEDIDENFAEFTIFKLSEK